MLWYVYPQWHTTSFSLIAKQHISYLRKKFGLVIHEIDELDFLILGFQKNQVFDPQIKPIVFIHPMFYIMERVIAARKDVRGNLDEYYYNLWRQQYSELIGVDVCDSDRLSEYAVSIANRMDKVIVPSSLCKNVYEESGVKVPVYRIPHGVDPEWYDLPNTWSSAPLKVANPSILQLFQYKQSTRKKLLLFWLMHSADRKGFPELQAVYRQLVKERDDVMLVLKTMSPNAPEYQMLTDVDVFNIYGWLSDTDKIALYDLADVTLLFTRGGGFEVNCLESLARGTPCVASDWGSWTDYLPSFLMVKRGQRVQPLPGNQIHSGYGYTVDVEDAVNKLHNVLDNLDEYKAKTLEWREKKLKNEYRWDIIAEQLKNLIP